ncbi:hypothetical protein F5148DRAFT_266572 [Russula earlei]|uniref:Uncharacterized protein n=1 Tax=Russula earlei TaxID=71964 RepID=A0ACC0UJD6_9AGAM|nr:hypothetical protein F5148DRAFT_266572 [Russula earlei]
MRVDLKRGEHEARGSRARDASFGASFKLNQQSSPSLHFDCCYMRLTAAFTVLPAISHTFAFSWSRNDVSRLPDHPEPEDLTSTDMGLDKDVIGFVDSRYMRKPDCFRRAARRIRVRCDEIDLDADQRVKAAISMTLCELRTAEFHSIPLECEVFSEEGGLSDRALHGICVEALARSTQSWASYSGYLREIPQLCSAYQRSNEKGTRVATDGPTCTYLSISRPRTRDLQECYDREDCIYPSSYATRRKRGRGAVSLAIITFRETPNLL